MTLYFINLTILAAMIILAWLFGWKIGLASISVGERWKVLSHVNARSSHERPTSRLGGVALAVGFFVPMAILILISWFEPHTQASWGGNLRVLAWIMTGAGAILIVGLADDVWDLPSGLKLGGQILAALMLLPADLRFLDLEFIPIPNVSPAGVMMAFSIVWVVFFVNAFNFMDGMDGYAARFTMHVCFWYFFTVVIKSLGLLEHEGMNLTELRLELFMVPILGGASAGFYRVNRSPARVFMGDSGSHLLGYLLAVFVLLGDGQYVIARPGWPKYGPTMPAGGIWIMMLPFIFDPLVTLIRRARLGENLLKAHRGHLYQRLMICGLSHAEVLRMNVWNFWICGALGFMFSVVPFAWARFGFGVAAMACLTVYWLRVLQFEAAVATSRQDER